DVIVAGGEDVLERAGAEVAEAEAADEFLVAIGEDFVSEKRRAHGAAAGRGGEDPAEFFGARRGEREIHFADDDAVGLVALLDEIDQLLLQLGDGYGFRSAHEEVAHGSLRGAVGSG